MYLRSLILSQLILNIIDHNLNQGILEVALQNPFLKSNYEGRQKKEKWVENTFLEKVGGAKNG
jgi:hypothetical protein